MISDHTARLLNARGRTIALNEKFPGITNRLLNGDPPEENCMFAGFMGAIFCPSFESISRTANPVRRFEAGKRCDLPQYSASATAWALAAVNSTDVIVSSSSTTEEVGSTEFQAVNLDMGVKSHRLNSPSESSLCPSHPLEVRTKWIERGDIRTL